MRRILSISLIVLICLSLCACSMPVNENYTPQEQPHLYWKDIDIVVEDVDRREWFATVHRRELSITVKSEEYGLSKTFNYSESEMINGIKAWNCKEGDIIKAELYSWVVDSTGEIVRRDINKLY